MLPLEEATTIFLGLAQLKGVGFKTLRGYGGVDAVAEGFATEGASKFIRRLSDEPLTHDVHSQVLRMGTVAAANIRNRGIHLVRAGDPNYPKRFEDLDENLRPLWFFYRGDVQLLSAFNVGVVGTRSPSDEGAFLAKYAVATVRALDACLVSGLAKGVDEIAHEWALHSGVKNISVLANGLLRVYPAKNADLADKIVDAGGVLISEYLPGEAPSAEAFVWRNRLQAALSNCVVAPEWKRASGTAHTIRFAKKLGRPTINLVSTGRTFSDDHGQADMSFNVPAEHTEFTDALRGTLAGGHEPPAEAHAKTAFFARQGDLFGATE
ncbi:MULTISPECIES: DNA-processing protein DprA [unclassified Caballeronia]|uniref:DNA-processing protein DprA n=1 Tax=unclassified Caballeronia TaxID=2646786 RepID=UPI0028636951|nr:MULTISPECIES: DNA-processing protein DprA [unclassified Caballeronia]MDR5776306.1 DNA-processing protein DprA [Caballeronia sp. LZ002]MDR5851912.1 DNA-processing protein DprA [Caballeronia sp. LZ003]